MYRRAITALALALTACNPSYDMQGHDPREYYAENPIKNTVGTQALHHILHLSHQTVARNEADKLRLVLGDISPSAIRNIHLVLPNSLSKPAQAKQIIAITRFLKIQGINATIKATSSYAVEPNHAEMQLIYSMVILPRCPDWRASPITDYSNANTGNFGCANTINLGKMVANPQDLVRGNGNIRPDIERNHLAIQQYYGVSTTSSAASPASSSASSSPESTSAAPQ